MRILLFAAGLLAASAQFAVQAQAPAPAVTLDAPQLERRLIAVETLIERSSAARQIDAAAVPAALEKRESARAAHRAARAAFEAGDIAKASLLLPEAAVRMFEAVKLAAPEQVTGAKLKSDLEARLESAKALAAAHRRIGAEKHAAPDTARAIDELIRKSEADIAAGRLEPARASIEQAYLLAKAAIGSMRGGDTLVRSLTFATKEEEYRYEVDRNDTHRMLLKILLDAAKGAQASESTDRAAALRVQAEGAARAGDHGAAIRMLEDSTRELVRAIRAAGVYIPG